MSSTNLSNQAFEMAFEMAFKMFDVNGDGTIDASEFALIMEMMRKRTPAGRQDRSLAYGNSSEAVPCYSSLFNKRYNIMLF